LFPPGKLATNWTTTLFTVLIRPLRLFPPAASSIAIIEPFPPSKTPENRMGLVDLFSDMVASLGFAEAQAEAPPAEDVQDNDASSTDPDLEEKHGELAEETDAENAESPEEEAGEAEGEEEGAEEEGEEEPEPEEPEDPKPKLEEGEFCVWLIHPCCSLLRSIDQKEINVLMLFANEPIN
jgi:hypothetical protein